MLANINNQMVSVKIIDNNYNDHAKEVQILEGTHKGQYAIVEDKDIIINTYKQLVELCDLDCKDKDLSDSNFTEFISPATEKFIISFANKYTLTNNEYYKLLTHIAYENCRSIEDVKLNILMNSIENSLYNIKSSFTSVKNKALKEV